MAGAEGSPGLPGTARAYGLVTPPCGGCGELDPGFTPLDVAHSKNVELGTPLPEAPAGAWCFVLKAGVDSHTATVVASVAEPFGPTAPGIPLTSVEWAWTAPDCPSGQIEIRTFGYRLEEEELVGLPDGEVAFSFAVP